MEKLFYGVKRASELVLARGAGTCVFTALGERYLDFTSGIGVTSTGHCHPLVVAAVQDQAARAVHLQQSIAYSDRMLELVERMERHTLGLGSFFFSNSGSEAVESALRLARHAKRRDGIIAFTGGYHGRTSGALAVTSSSVVYRGERSGPLPSGTHFAPYPYHYQGVSDDDALAQLELMLKQQVAPSEVAAVLIEPVMGEGGYVPASPSFMRALRAYCDRHDFLLIADEVQAGYGRTGRMFSCEHAEVTPDILVIAKGIASGYPLSAVVTKEDISALQMKGSMGGTYGGNAVACAAAIATLDVIENENLLSNAVARGKQAMDALTGLQSRSDLFIGDVRGLGLMIGVEFNSPGMAAKVAAKCLENNLLVLTTGVHDCVRIIPPLTVSADEMDEGMAIFSDAVVGAAAEL